MTKPRLLIIGHGRHGKDTVAEILRDYHGFKFTSSSLFCAVFVRDALERIGVHYTTLTECYEDRHNHRIFWFSAITEYNSQDPTRTASEMLADGFDMYVGMRSRREYDACMKEGVFDYVIWVDRSMNLPEESSESMNLTEQDAQLKINNNGSLHSLWMQVDSIVNGYLS